MEIKRVALVGLGAIGSYLAPRLERALGHENFLVVASGERRGAAGARGAPSSTARPFTLPWPTQRRAPSRRRTW